MTIVVLIGIVLVNWIIKHVLLNTKRAKKQMVRNVAVASIALYSLFVTFWEMERINGRHIMKDAEDLFRQAEYWMDKGVDYFITSFRLCSQHETMQAIKRLKEKYDSKDFSYHRINWGDVCKLIDRDCLCFYFPFWLGELYMYEYDMFLQICWKERTREKPWDE